MENYFRKFRLSIGSSVTRLGDFLMFLVTNFLTEVAQILGEFWAFYKISFFD